MSKRPALRRAASRTSLRRAEFYAIGLAVAFVGVFALAAALSGGGEMLARLQSLSPALLAGLLGLSLVNYALRALRWQIFTDQLRLAVDWPSNALYFVAGFAMTVTPGKVGEALRLWFLNRGHNLRYERTAALFLADRLSDAGAVLTLCLIALAVASGELWSALAIALLVLAATLLFLFPAPLLAATGWTYGRLRRWPRIFARLRAALRQLRRLASWRVYGGTLLLALAGWMAEAYAFDWLLRELGAEIGLGQAVFIFTFAMVVGTAAMLPGGLGGTEVGMVGLLLAVGVDFEVALLATAVIRATTLWFAVILGFAALPLAMKRARRGL
jgi:uncharacterized protein (TIRG00374 family)